MLAAAGCRLLLIAAGCCLMLLGCVIIATAAAASAAVAASVDAEGDVMNYVAASVSPMFMRPLIV